MTEATNTRRPYDLEERTYQFALRIRSFVKKLPMTIANREDARQLVNASGSVGANYIEANEALSRKDFVMRVKISRKEAKEAAYWLRLVDVASGAELIAEKDCLLQEAHEIRSILSSILTKSQSN